MLARRRWNNQNERVPLFETHRLVQVKSAPSEELRRRPTVDAEGTAGVPVERSAGRGEVHSATALLRWCRPARLFLLPPPSWRPAIVLLLLFLPPPPSR